MHQRLINDIESSNLLYISSTKIDDDFKTSFHSHPNLEIILITNGDGYIYTATNKIKVNKGSLVILNQDAKHYEGKKGLSFYAIGIKKINFFDPSYFDKRILDFKLSEAEYYLYNNFYSLIYNELFEKKNDYEIIVNNSVETLLKLITRKNLSINNNISEESDLVSNIKSIIDTYYYQSISLDDIAHKLSESKSNICHEFKKYTNCSIIEYKINRQLEEACNLLNISDMNISQVSSFVGFNSTSYFIKYFKKKYQMTPKEYKKLSKVKED